MSLQRRPLNSIIMSSGRIWSIPLSPWQRERIAYDFQKVKLSHCSVCVAPGTGKIIGRTGWGWERSFGEEVYSQMQKNKQRQRKEKETLIFRTLSALLFFSCTMAGGLCVISVSICTFTPTHFYTGGIFLWGGEGGAGWGWMRWMR